MQKQTWGEKLMKFIDVDAIEMDENGKPAGISLLDSDIKDIFDNEEDSNKNQMFKDSNYTWTYVPTKAEHYFEVVDTKGNPVDSATVIVTAKSKSFASKTISKMRHNSK